MEHKGIRYDIEATGASWTWEVRLDDRILRGTTRLREVAILQALKAINRAIKRKALANKSKIIRLPNHQLSPPVPAKGAGDAAIVLPLSQPQSDRPRSHVSEGRTKE
jgi:hypothetical protein